MASWTSLKKIETDMIAIGIFENSLALQFFKVYFLLLFVTFDMV